MKFKKVFNTAVYEPKLWEKVLLWFRPVEEYVGQDCLIYYKTLYDRFYMLLVMRFIQPVTQEVKPEKPMPGFDSPWEN
jgi:hypothetical protein